MRPFIYFTLLILAVGTATFFYFPNEAEAENFTTVEATPFLLEKVERHEWVLIDVRSPEEYHEGHIPGAINLPHDEIGKYVSKLDDVKDKPIIIYCRSGRRAQLAMKVLEEKAFKHVRHLEGDMMGWSEAGLPIDRM